jgi:hypothetical protein
MGVFLILGLVLPALAWVHVQLLLQAQSKAKAAQTTVRILWAPGFEVMVGPWLFGPDWKEAWWSLLIAPAPRLPVSPLTTHPPTLLHTKWAMSWASHAPLTSWPLHMLPEYSASPSLFVSSSPYGHFSLEHSSHCVDWVPLIWNTQDQKYFQFCILGELVIYTYIYIYIYKHIYIYIHIHSAIS